MNEDVRVDARVQRLSLLLLEDDVCVDFDLKLLEKVTLSEEDVVVVVVVVDCLD